MIDDVWNLSVFAECSTCCVPHVKNWARDIHKRIPTRNSHRSCPTCKTVFYLVVSREDRTCLIGKGRIPKLAVMFESTIQPTDVLVTNVS